MKDYWLLVRPRILALVLVAVGVSACATAEHPPPLHVLVHAMFGTALLVAGALALNQWWELQSDSRMPRTAPRPLPTGRLSRRRAGWFGLGLSSAGMGYLAMTHWETLLPLGILPTPLSLAGWGYGISAFLLGLAYFGSAAWFGRRRDDLSARWLLRASLIYLSLLLAALLVGKTCPR